MQLSAAIYLVLEILLMAVGRFALVRFGENNRARNNGHGSAKACMFLFRDFRRDHQDWKRLIVHSRIRKGLCVDCGEKPWKGRRFKIQLRTWASG